MEYVTVAVFCEPDLTDYLISELFQEGFDSFQELDHGFEATCEKSVYQSDKVEGVLSQFPGIRYSIKAEEKINWNEAWEKNYDPIIVEDRCMVRAEFHPPGPEYDFEIIVTPKMSFGTGHHATTYQVLAYQMQLDHEGKRVLDVGTGTGILTIMAAKRGAGMLTASDIDDWCIENSLENFRLNAVENVSVFKGEVERVPDAPFDIILANINKNVLLAQMGHYSEKLSSQGVLVLSGFYLEDVNDLEAAGAAHGLKKLHQTTKDNWAMLVLSQQSV